MGLRGPKKQGSGNYRRCSALGCNKKHFAKGFCVKHYFRQKRGKIVVLKKQPAKVPDRSTQHNYIPRGMTSVVISKNE